VLSRPRNVQFWHVTLLCCNNLVPCHGCVPAHVQSLEERCNQMLRNMEASLTARDRVGIQDFVLLDAYTSESAFLDNLRKRFHENLIYVSLPAECNVIKPDLLCYSH